MRSLTNSQQSIRGSVVAVAASSYETSRAAIYDIRRFRCLSVIDSPSSVCVVRAIGDRIDGVLRYGYGGGVVMVTNIFGFTS